MPPKLCLGGFFLHSDTDGVSEKICFYSFLDDWTDRADRLFDLFLNLRYSGAVMQKTAQDNLKVYAFEVSRINAATLALKLRMLGGVASIRTIAVSELPNCISQIEQALADAADEVEINIGSGRTLPMKWKSISVPVFAPYHQSF